MLSLHWYAEQGTNSSTISIKKSETSIFHKNESFWIKETYIVQLLKDIKLATENISWPYREKEVDVWDWIPDEEEERIAPFRELEEWTGLRQEMLPPETMLNDHQVSRLLGTLKNMLDEYNWSFVLQLEVPERIQYETIRQNFKQQAQVKRWHPGFFELCSPGTSP